MTLCGNSRRGTHTALCSKLCAVGNDQTAWACEDTPKWASRAYAVAQGVGTRDIQPAGGSVLVVAGVGVWGGGAASDGEVAWVGPAIQWQVKRPADMEVQPMQPAQLPSTCGVQFGSLTDMNFVLCVQR